MLLLLLLLPAGCLATPTVTDLYWNTSNPVFRTGAIGPPYSHQILVNQGGGRGREFDQLHLWCPLDGREELIIYRVSLAEYLSCRVADPTPQVVMDCSSSRPTRLRTITFRPYSPTPGGLEFPPDSEHFFLSTSSPGNIASRRGGVCQTHNMRLAIKVASDGPAPDPFPTLPPRFRPLPARIDGPSLYAGPRPRVPSSEFLYYYSPRDLLRLSSAARRGHLSTEQEDVVAAPRVSAASVRTPCYIWPVLLAALALMI